MTERIGMILGSVRRKLKNYKQEGLEDPDLLDAGNRIQDDIFMKADIDRKFDIALVGGQEAYDMADEDTFEIDNKMNSWEEGMEFVPKIEWETYRLVTGMTYPYYLTIFARHLYVAPIPEAAWVASDSPIITLWGKQKKTIVPMDENTDPEVPTIFDNAIIAGICKEYESVFLGEYLMYLNDAKDTYNNSKLGILTPDAQW